MAKRCPDSKYVGTATLPNYRWMINERGYANVVPSKDDWVEGLVFEITDEDERRLDKSEGVTKHVYVEGKQGPCYKKYYMPLKVHRAPKSLYRRPLPWIVSKGGVGCVVSEAQIEGNSGRHHVHETKIVLVYASPDFVKDATPRTEYVARINSGIADARALGVSPHYIEMFVRRNIPPDGQARTGLNARLWEEEMRPRAHAIVDTSKSAGRGRDRPRMVDQYASARQGQHIQDEKQGRQERDRLNNEKTVSAFAQPSRRSQSLNRPPVQRWNIGNTRIVRSLSMSRRER